jgi:hypothetical protein
MSATSRSNADQDLGVLEGTRAFWRQIEIFQVEAGDRHTAASQIAARVRKG